jgi:citrate synthase
MVPDSASGPVSIEKSEEHKATSGLAGIIASDSQVSLVDGVEGKLLYRGYDIADLAEHATFEETAFLLWNGRLPTRAELKAFTAEAAAARKLPPEVVRMLKSMPRDAPPMDALRTAVSLLGVLDPRAREDSMEARHSAAIRLLAAMPTIVAAQWRLSQGLKVVAPRKSGSTAANFLRMLLDKEPSKEDARAMDVALILHADHEFNASTFAARVTASTLSDVYSAITSAVGALKGPLHGGANREVMRALEQIGSTDKVDSYVDRKLAAHEKVMGFGHRVYKTMDPRARILKVLSKERGAAVGQLKWYEMSARMEETVRTRKNLYPNVDFYAASLYHVMGIPRPIFPSLFAISRISGWLAHVLEQYADNKLIRPLANYTGPKGLKYVSIGRRK